MDPLCCVGSCDIASQLPGPGFPGASDLKLAQFKAAPTSPTTSCRQPLGLLGLGPWPCWDTPPAVKTRHKAQKPPCSLPRAPVSAGVISLRCEQVGGWVTVRAQGSGLSKQGFPGTPPCQWLSGHTRMPDCGREGTASGSSSTQSESRPLSDEGQEGPGWQPLVDPSRTPWREGTGALEMGQPAGESRYRQEQALGDIIKALPGDLHRRVGCRMDFG